MVTDDRCGGIRVKTAIVTAVLAWFWAASAWAEPSVPGFETVQLRPVTPAEAHEYYTGQTEARVSRQAPSTAARPRFMLTDGGPQVDAEIVELARGLRYDPDLMYRFVHDHIEHSPIWGDVKGAYMTLMDRSGNSFDQASLLIALLKQAELQNGQPDARYAVQNPRWVYGEIRLSVAAAANWLGVPEGVNVVYNLLANAGIPVEYQSSTQTFLIGHAWVKVSIDGSDYVFDPSYKSHQIKTRWTDAALLAAMGYDRATFVAHASTGATIGSDYVKDINKQNVTDDLKTYSTNLINTLKTSYPNAGLDDIIGGHTVIPAEEEPLRQTLLPYQESIEAQWTQIPVSFRTSVRLQHQGIDVTLYSSDIYGRRLTVSYNASNRPELRLDGTLLATGNPVTIGQTYAITVTIDHPYVDGQADQSGQLNVKAGGFYQIVNGWAQTGRAILETHRRRAQEYLHAGMAEDSEAVQGESFALLSLTWLAETSKFTSLLSEISDVTIVNHHRVGVAGQSDGPYIDMPICLHGGVHHEMSETERWTASLIRAGQSSAFEYGVVEQLQDYGAVSTVKLLDVANDRTAYDKVFDVTSSNFSGVRSQLSAYTTQELDNIQNNYINQGFRVILPQYGDLGEVEDGWKGYGFLGLKTAGELWTFTYIIAGGYNGGYASSSGDIQIPQIVYGRVNNDPTGVPDRWGPKTSDPIDLLTGACLYEQQDLSLGSATSPLGLGLGRSYSSYDRLEDNGLGLGWRHGLDIKAKPGSDGFQAMGDDSAVDAAACLVQISVASDLLNAGTSLLHLVVTSLSQRWLMDQMIDNVVIIDSPGDIQQFVKLPDDSYNPPPGQSTRLTVATDPQTGEPQTGALMPKSGDRMDFAFYDDSEGNRVGHVTQVSDPHGNAINFTYASNKLTQVANNFGKSLTLHYTGDRINSITDSADRGVTYAYDTAGNLQTATDVEGYVTTFVYDPDQVGQLTQIFYPTDPANPYVTNVYDSLGRVKQQTNANGYTYDYYYAHYRTEELRPGEIPPGETTPLRFSDVYTYNRDGKLIVQTDPLGRQTKYGYDAHRRPAKVTYPPGNSAEFSYDQNHNVTQTVAKPIPGSSEPNIVASSVFGTYVKSDRWFNLLTQSTDSAGNVTTYEHDYDNVQLYGSDVGNLMKVTYPLVQTWTGPATPIVQYTYNTQGRIATITDANSIVTKCEYYLPAEGGDLKKTIVDHGATGHLNITTELAYDDVGNVISVTDPRGNIAHQEYYESRLLKNTVAPAPFNYEAQYEYFKDGKVKQVKQQSGVASSPWQIATYTYTPSGQQQTSLGPIGTAATDSLQAHNGVVNGASWTGAAKAGGGLEFDGADDYVNCGNSSAFKITGNLGLSLWLKRQAAGNAVFVIEGGTGSSLVDNTLLYVGIESDGRLKYMHEGALLWFSVAQTGYFSTIPADTWTHVVIVRNNTSKTVTAYVNGSQAGTPYTYSYVPYSDNAAPKLTMASRSDGHTNFKGTLDEICLFTRTLQTSEIQQLYQNGNGGQSALTGFAPGNYPMSYWNLDEALTHFTQYQYDSLDRPWKTTDAEGKVTETRYFPDGQLWKVIDAAGHETVTNTYNDDGTLYSVEDAKGNPTFYEYDGHIRSKKTTFADGTYQQLTYDNAGRLQQTRTRAANVIGFAYNTLNRVTTKTLPGNTVTSQYDIGGKVVDTIDGTGMIHNSFDSAGRLIYVTSANRATISYEYDLGSNRTKLHYPDGTYISYEYDQLDRLTKVRDAAGAILAQYTCDTLSRRQTTTNLNGTSTQYQYDMADRLLSINNLTTTGNHKFAYTYNRVGNRLTMLVNDTQSHSYAYDNIYQLTSVDYPAGFFASDLSFNYDPAGNRSSTINGGTVSYVANPLNQYTSVGGVSYSYDYSGNLTSDGTNTYTYDAENRLITAVTPAHSAGYTYDPAGRRICKTVDGTLTQYVYDGDDVIGEYDATGHLSRKFVYGAGVDEVICQTIYDVIIADVNGDCVVNTDDMPAIAQAWLAQVGNPAYNHACDFNADGEIDNADSDILSENWLVTSGPAQTYYYHYDGLGSVIALTDSSGHTVETCDYTVYGQANVTIISGTGTGNPHLFTGRWFDSETGLYYYRARYYAPGIGRFLQTDPIGYADGVNWYLYCANNPVLLVDPSGLCGGGSSYLSAFSSVSGLMSGYGRDVVTHTGQALLNGVQSVQDAAVGVWDVFLTDSSDDWLYVPSPQWARGLIDEQSTLSYEAEKIIWTAGLAKVISPASSATNAAKNFRAFKSFNALRSALGPAGKGRVWHHIVERREANVKLFGAKAIHNTTNVVAVPREVNQAIADFYSSKRGFTGGMRVREWLSSQSWEQQYEFGRGILEAALSGKPLPQ